MRCAPSVMHYDHLHLLYSCSGCGGICCWWPSCCSGCHSTGTPACGVVALHVTARQDRCHIRDGAKEGGEEELCHDLLLCWDASTHKHQSTHNASRKSFTSLPFVVTAKDNSAVLIATSCGVAVMPGDTVLLTEPPPGCAVPRHPQQAQLGRLV